MDMDPAVLADQLADLESVPLEERAGKLAELQQTLREALDSSNPS